MDGLFPPGALPIPLEVQIAEVEQELKMRRRVYPVRVRDGRMTQQRMDRQIEVMQAVLATLYGLQRRL